MVYIILNLHNDKCQLYFNKAGENNTTFKSVD